MVRPLFSVSRKTFGSNGGFRLLFRTSIRFMQHLLPRRVILQGGMKRSTQSLRTLKNSYVSSNKGTAVPKSLTFNPQLIRIVRSGRTPINWGGWTLGSTAAKQVKDAEQASIVRVLAPICADKFQRSADVSANLEALKKTDSWNRDELIEKAGWATFPGSEPDRKVAQACAN